MSIHLVPAEAADLPVVAMLMNAAFRGPASERSWSVETGYLRGERTNASLLREELAAGARLLLAKDQLTGAIEGCVSLRVVSPGRWYLGSLAVDPALQNAGFGRQLLAAAEQYAASRGVCEIEIAVLNVRQTLIAWYERRGYTQTGERHPFPYGDDRFGTPMRDDLEFVVLAKGLQRPDEVSLG